MAIDTEAAPAYTSFRNAGHEHEENIDLAVPPPPYPTSLPDTFPIGNKKTSPLVTVEELQAHLRILGAFDALRQQVNNAAGPDGWAVFLARAVYRFQKWVSQSIVSAPPITTVGCPYGLAFISTSEP